MIVKGIGATTHMDRHNCRIAKEALEDAVKDMNEGLYAVGVGMEHDPTVMPIGKVLSGRMVMFEDGEYGIEIEQEIFEKCHIYKDVENEKWYIVESETDKRPFADTLAETIHNMKVAVDPVNFSSEDYEKLLEFYEKDCSLDTECFIRKSVVPDPEIIFTFVKGTLAVLAGNKITEKLAGQMANDAVKLYEVIKKAVLETLKRLKPGNKLVTYVIKEYNPYLIELVVAAETPEPLLEALQPEKMRQIEKRIENFTNTFDVDIAKIQCIYNIERQKWEVNYVSTKEGQVIGSEKCYKKTTELVKKIRTESAED